MYVCFIVLSFFLSFTIILLGIGDLEFKKKWINKNRGMKYNSYFSEDVWVYDPIILDS